MTPIWSVGLMTGTVLDGNIDVALIRTDGERVESFGPYTLAPYPREIVAMLQEAQRQALDWNFSGPEPAIFREAEEVLTRAQSAAVKELVESAGMTMADIGVVGFHGQTVLHRAPTKDLLGDTRQLGDGELMHKLLGVQVVYDFRSADMRCASAQARSLTLTGATPTGAPRHLFATPMQRSIPHASTSSGIPPTDDTASTIVVRPRSCAVQHRSPTGLTSPMRVSWWTTAIAEILGQASRAACTIDASSGWSWGAARLRTVSPAPVAISTSRSRSFGARWSTFP
jgi:hypothetical protein